MPSGEPGGSRASWSTHKHFWCDSKLCTYEKFAHSVSYRRHKSMSGTVQAVSCSPTHTFTKPKQESIRLLTGQGVEGDAHLGETVKHRSRVARDPSQPNLRQVHLIHAEVHDELRATGFVVSAGQMGENVTTA